MNFLNIILQNSSVKEAKLYPAAKRASENPALGITIQNQAAYHVIKDCANITQLYLPLFVFSSYADPFKTLSKKFKKEDIVEFVNACKTNGALNQLLEIILYKASQIQTVKPSAPSQTFQPNDDPYGDYALYVEDQSSNQIQSDAVLTTTTNPIEILCAAFEI